MSRWLGLLILLLAPAGVCAQKAKPGSDLSPDFMIVSSLDVARGQLHLKLTQMREQEVQELTVGPGVTLKSEKVVGPFQVDRYLKLKKCKILTASGEVVSPASYARRLKAGVVVVMSTDGHPPAKAFLQLLRPDTLIVIGPVVKPDPRIKLPPPPPPMPRPRD